MLLILTSCACAHSPGEAPRRSGSTESATTATSSSASEADRATPGETIPEAGGPVAASLFSAVMGYDPRLSPDHGAVTRVSFFEALELANALSTRAGMPPCYEVRCDGAAMVGCAREGQPYCEDLRKCTAHRSQGPCGYRLPEDGSGDGEVAVWLERDGDLCAVGGRTRLSSPDAGTTRRAPVRCTLKADHVGIALTRGENTSPSPGRGRAEPLPP